MQVCFWIHLFRIHPLAGFIEQRIESLGSIKEEMQLSFDQEGDCCMK